MDASSSPEPSSPGSVGEARGSRTDSVSSPDFPTAIIHMSSQSGFSQHRSRLWFVSAACLLTAAGLVLSSQRDSGPEIRIFFKNGHGILAGHRLEHRGIEIGTVISVTLASTSERRGFVQVTAELHPEASEFARHGSEFWIVRPEISLSHVAGLETVLGARYISAIPGDAEGIDERDFQGRESPLRIPDPDGTEVTIHFSSGHGLNTGDPVRHREIVIGEVTGIDLEQNLEGVIVRARLTGRSAAIARQGTRFWIERPTISSTGVRGLGTLLGGRYVAVDPGTPPADRERPVPVLEFQGLDIPPVASATNGGLEIVLESPQRSGLRRGIPVLYRGIPIGRLMSVRLASDAASVEAYAGIEPAYRHLVRQDSVFWNSSGVDFRLGLDGVRLNTETLTSVVTGGVSMATPDEPGAAVLTGHRFRCVSEPRDEWLEWTPHLPLRLNSGSPLPSPIRASLQWEQRFVFRRSEQQTGWVLPLEGGILCGPANLLMPVAEAISGQRLEIAGQKTDVNEHNTRLAGNGLALLKPDSELPPQLPLWPLSEIGQASSPVDCLIVSTGLDSSVSLHAHRLTVDQTGDWRLSESIPLSADLHGASVVSRENGKLIGFLLIAGDTARIAHFHKTARDAFAF